MQALRIYAGPRARLHLGQNGLSPADVGVIPGAAGGPKGLILGPLDRFLFGQWLPQSQQPIHLVGASIGAWRMATACLSDPVAAFKVLERDYIAQHYELKPGEKRPSSRFVSEQFGQNLARFYDGRIAEVLKHPRYRLHVITSRGRHVLGREGPVRTPMGYLGAFLTNTVRRKSMGAWLERVVFSSQPGGLPFTTDDYRTRRVALTEANFKLAVQASCSIPFVLQAVHDIPGAPRGAYWDGGIIDYHLHLDYILNKNSPEIEANNILNTRPDSVNLVDKNISVLNLSPSRAEGGQSDALSHAPKDARPRSEGKLVLYPHFQKAVVPGWLDKSLKWRHKATRHLDNMLLLAPNPEWVKTLPNAKLPDRKDFVHYGNDLTGRVKAWTTAASASQQMADEFEGWLQKPDMGQVHAI